jgi:hydrogenase maturation protein HypF
VSQIVAYRYLITGQVQGVGFRPFVYRLAQHYHLAGWVQNLSGQVAIHLQGHEAAMVAFEHDLIAHAPPLAHPHISERILVDCVSQLDFQIRHSDATLSPQIHVPPDYFTCNDCLLELHTPTDRRYRYPFINCTQCGPRYTIIHQMPYDRSHTSMANFPLCPDCAQEYYHPSDRRFHAQPIACPICGPHLSFYQQDNVLHDTATALTATIAALRDGKIVAVKGIGGYHLICDAQNDDSILRLRANKPRLHKPLAVMLPLNFAETVLATQITVTTAEMQQLLHPARPIVLVTKTAQFSLSPHLAPQLNEIGVLLPYSPLHHILLTEFAHPLVVTSANRSGEPVFTENQEVVQHLGQVAEAFLHHNRPIVRPADDSVFKTILRVPRPLRLGRGHAPLEWELPIAVARPMLAVGAHLKNTIALAWNQRVVVSPHIGDLSSPRSIDVFMQVIEDLQQLYAVRAEKVLTDAHPQFANTRWAQQTQLPTQPILHHHAHASALAGEFPELHQWLMFTWDGVGVGTDGNLWGGETLYGQAGAWQRVGHLRPFKLLGGEKASRELWRSALSICFETGYSWHPPLELPIELLHTAWQKNLNCPQTTAVGRLFDAVASWLGVLQVASFEGQGAAYLEALCQSENTAYCELSVSRNQLNLWEINWENLLNPLLDPKLSLSYRASLFHNSLAHAMVTQMLHIAQEFPIQQIGLCGGVFQNRYLTERVVQLFENSGKTVYFPQRLPCNDASISFGQIIEYASSTANN